MSSWPPCSFNHSIINVLKFPSNQITKYYLHSSTNQASHFFPTSKILYFFLLFFLLISPSDLNHRSICSLNRPTIPRRIAFHCEVVPSSRETRWGDAMSTKPDKHPRQISQLCTVKKNPIFREEIVMMMRCLLIWSRLSLSLFCLFLREKVPMKVREMFVPRAKRVTNLA